MKKVFFILVFAGLAVAIMHSCKKDKFEDPENNQIVQNPQNNSLWFRIVDFREKINASERDENFITPDSALWYLEALFNIEQSANTNYNYLDLDTSFYTLVPDENGLVNLSDVSLVYDEMVENLGIQLEGKDSDYAFLIIGDLSNITTNRDGTYEIQSINGIGIDPLICYDPFYDIDDWYYGNNLGRLDGAYLWESDAGYELEKRFNNPLNCSHIGGGYWVSIEPKEADSLEYTDFKYHEYSSTIPWINDTLMRHYLSSGHSEIIYKYEADGGKRPAGKDFKYCDIWTNNANPPSTLYFHSYTLWYGIQINDPQ